VESALNMVVDCFTFFNELELLEIRLHELDPWVDRFVLVESRETFTGNPKPLYFDENKHLFEQFLPKIHHLVSPSVGNSKTFWDREKNQRDFIMVGLSDCNENDLVLISDVDEIPKGLDFSKVYGESADNSKKWMIPFRQKQFFFYMNFFRDNSWKGSVLMPYKNIKSTFGNSPHKARLNRRHGGSLADGGWHFTFMGGVDAIVEKARAYCHFGSRQNKVLESEGDAREYINVSSCMVKGIKLKIVRVDESYPTWFRTNIKKFEHLLWGMEGMIKMNKAARAKTYVDRVTWASKLLDEITLEGQIIGVEVGLWKGDFASMMLDENRRLKWIAVDPYSEYGARPKNQAWWDGICKKVVSKMDRFGDRFTLIRKSSKEGVKDLPNNVDFVFVDGNHDYKFVCEDVSLFEKKIRPGGIMSGHDYFFEDIYKAVDEYAEEHNRDLQYSFDFDPYGIFWWKMP